MRIIHAIIQTKRDIFPQIFDLDLRKAIRTALTKIFCIKLKISPESRQMIIKVFWKKSFRSRKYLLDNLTSVSTAAQKTLPNSEKVLVTQLPRTYPFFPECFFKRPSGDLEFSYDNPDGKSLPKVEFFCSKCQIDFKKSFWKVFFQKRSNGHIEGSAVLRKVARQKSVKHFWAEWVKV